MAKELSNIEKDMAEIESERTPTSEKERRIPYDDKPSKIIEYLRYVYNLHFAETPNYDLMARRIS